MIKVGIVGSEGYAVGELYSLLVNHPDVVLSKMFAPSRVGCKVSDLHPGLFGERNMTFTDDRNFDDLDVLFICLESRASKAFLENNALPEKLKLIDFSMVHRLPSDMEPNTFLYGLPECYRREICSAHRVVIPGCFASSIEISLIPLAKNLSINSEIHVTSVAGKTEAAARPRTDVPLSYHSLFDHFAVYKPFEHPQAVEVGHVLADIQKSFDQPISFIPMRGNFNRGIYTTTYLKTALEIEEVRRMFEVYYEDHSFVHIVDYYPDVREITNTNDALLHLSKHGKNLLIVCALDNLMKGAAGTAVHVMNLMENLVETTGLKLKSSAF